MKNLFVLIVLAVSLPAAAQLAAVNGFCENGAQSASISGMQSTNKLQGITPGCLVTPYLTGTTTLATYYLTPTGSPQTGPFTADTTTGQYLFYAISGASLDVTRSSGTTQSGVNTDGLTTPVIISQGGTSAITAQGAATNIVDGSAINPSSIGQTGIPGPAAFSSEVSSVTNLTYTPAPGTSLQAAITTAGSNSDIALSCGTWTVSAAATISASSVHLHGVSKDCTFIVNAQSSPTYSLIITGSNVEVDHIGFSGPTQVTIYVSPSGGGGNNVKIHDSSFTQGGAVPGYIDAAIGFNGGTGMLSHEWIYDNVFTGDGEPFTSSNFYTPDSATPTSITATSCSGGGPYTCTFTAANTLSSNAWVTVAGVSNLSPASQTVEVIAADLSGSQFDAIVTGSGSPTGSGTFYGNCSNYQTAGILKTIPQGGTWGPVACPNHVQSGVNDVFASNVDDIHVLRNRVSGGNVQVPIGIFASDFDIQENNVDQNGAYSNYSQVAAVAGQGHAINLYGVHLSQYCPTPPYESFSRVGGTVTLTCNGGSTLPSALFFAGRSITVTDAYGSTSDFSGTFIINSVTSGPNPTLIYTQSGQDDTATSADSVFLALVNGVVAHNQTNRTAGSGIYLAGAINASVLGNTVQNAGYFTTNTSICVGGIALNSADGSTTSGNVINQVNAVNLLTYAGLNSTPSGICSVASYGSVIANNIIHNYDYAGVEVRSGQDVTVNANDIDATGNARYGIFSLDTGNYVNGLTVTNNHVRHATYAGVYLGNGATNRWGEGIIVDNNIIYGNTVAAKTQYGIQVLGALPVHVCGNYLFGEEVNQTATSAIVIGIYNSHPSSLICDNQVSYTSSIAFDDTSSAHTVYSKNSVSACTDGIVTSSGTNEILKDNVLVGCGLPLLLGASGAIHTGNQFTTTGTSMGTCTLVTGSCTVSTIEIQTGDYVRLTRQATGGTIGNLSVGTIVNGTSFPINSSSSTDTSVVFWEIVH